MNRGYIKIWRKLDESGLIQMPNTLALFMHILLSAANKDKKLGTPKGVITVKRGQYVSGRKRLAEILEQTEREIRTSITRLVELEIIDQQTTSRYSVYTIVNYDKYQSNENQTTSTTPSKRPTDDQHNAQQTTTKQEIKQNLKPSRPENRKPVFETDDLRFAEFFFAELLKINPSHKKPNLDAWANDARLMRERDSRTLRDAAELVRWCITDPFWKTNILSVAKLREKWDALTMKKNASNVVNPDWKKRPEFAGML